MIKAQMIKEKASEAFIKGHNFQLLFCSSMLLCFVPLSEILIGFTSIQIVKIGLKQFNLYGDFM